MKLHRHAKLNDPAVRHGWTDDTGPDFKVDPESAEHAGLVEDLAAEARLSHAAWVRQVHGGTALYVDGPGFAGEADALWTDVPGLGVIGRSADCPLILVTGTRQDGVVLSGFAHASWRSTVEDITGKLLERMIAGGLDPKSARSVLCPSAGPCCYEIGEEVRQAALDKLGSESGWFFLERVGSMTFDLWAANRSRMEACGLPTASIALAEVCTICGKGYPSYRRDGERAGRFAAIIGAAVQGPAGA